MLRTVLIASFALVALAAAPALAHTGYGDLEADVQAAHDYWHSEVCGRQWVITPDATLRARGHGGEATGIAAYVDESGRWVWHIERCEFTVDPTLEGCEREAVIRHEIGHFVHGPGHDGPMSPQALEVPYAACLQHAQPVSATVSARTVAAPSRSAAIIAAVRARLPMPRAWRIICAPARRATRCRATVGRAVRRYSVRRARSRLIVTRLHRRGSHQSSAMPRPR
jgi:hypothetical protein